LFCFDVVALFVAGFKKPGFFLKAQPSGFLSGFIGFFGPAGKKVGKIIQKLSNLKP